MRLLEANVQVDAGILSVLQSASRRVLASML